MENLLQNTPMPCKSFHASFYQTTDGWAFLYLTASCDTDDRALGIRLSYAEFSFDHFVNWLKTVETSRNEARYYFEEEGPSKDLVIVPAQNTTETTIRLLLTNGYEPTVAYIDVELQRQEFVNRVRGSLRYFFNRHFRPRYWDLCGSSYHNGHALLRRMKADEWLQIKQPGESG